MILIHSFLYKNTLYKNIEAQIVPKNKNKLRTSEAHISKFKIRTNQKDLEVHEQNNNSSFSVF